jgi:hypothetical protein
MLAVSQGRLVVLSTPFGQRGWFYDEWQGSGPWQKVRVTWHDCPRITDFIAEDERALGRSWVAQEYECSFEAIGLVYPDFAHCVADLCAPIGKPVSGIDRPRQRIAPESTSISRPPRALFARQPPSSFVSPSAVTYFGWPSTIARPLRWQRSDGSSSLMNGGRQRGTKLDSGSSVARHEKRVLTNQSSPPAP